MVFISTLPAGLEKPIEKRLASELKPVRIFTVADGLAMYDTTRGDRVIQKLPYLNNSFVLLKKLDTRKGFEQAVNEICTCRQLPGLPRGARGFRVLFSDENTFVSVNKASKDKLERFLSYHFKLKPLGSKAEMELWLMKRRGGEMFFVRRLPGKSSGGSVKGKLRPELADMMCYLAQVGRNDRVWDPFCGYGAIVEAAVRYKPAVIDAGDIDPSCVAITRKSEVLRLASQNQQKLDIRQSDVFRAAAVIPDGSMDKIITDPPWGLFDQKTKTEVEEFYQRILRVFSDKLKTKGLIIVLTSRETDVLSVLPPGQLTLVDRYGVLVNGKKASVNIIRKGEKR